MQGEESQEREMVEKRLLERTDTGGEVIAYLLYGK